MLSLTPLAYSAESKPGVSGILSLSPIPMVYFKIEAQLLSKNLQIFVSHMVVLNFLAGCCIQLKEGAPTFLNQAAGSTSKGRLVFQYL